MAGLVRARHQLGKQRVAGFAGIYPVCDLASYPGTLLVISHDRDLLNQSVDHIMHLEQGKLSLYRGGYDQFERQRAEKQALQLKLKKKQEDERRHLQAFVDRFKAIKEMKIPDEFKNLSDKDNRDREAALAERNLDFKNRFS